MSMLSLRLPESLHEMARELAKEENISINQLITLALAEKLSALKAEEFFKDRAKRANRDDYFAVLAKVPAVEPDESDKLPKNYRRKKQHSLGR
jgi:hypothetical protein